MSEPVDSHPTRPPRPSMLDDPNLAALASEPLQVIGRFRVEKVLGEGSFGRVYLAHDDQLQRRVAIKVPHAHRAASSEDAAAYLAEARILARLDHPHIVPVYDVGQTTDGLCFVVSKFVEGSDLAKRIKKGRPALTEAAEWVAMVAEALDHAHGKGLVHRDIKPANILLDSAGQPLVADFGLALKEEDWGQGGGFAGTPAYMSPEQARGEGHRVDGRSDLFSLSVVFYELLTGRRPFRGADLTELLEQITSTEVRPLRQIDDAIPRELERICLKGLAKRASERYPTARDLAADLRHYLAPAAVPGGVPVATPVAALPPATLGDQGVVKIVPKGLRAFEAADADSFLELLPGPRDRDGLPDSIRFWKARIEETDPDQTFRVGLLYGPSGCGKSSLVKAGLIPRLADHVTVAYVEAAVQGTEARLLKGLRKQCPALADDLGLPETLAALRKGRGCPAGKKVLIVLDQFEQWLHALRGQENTELVQALRQCDGERVQCLLLVRDDFWMAVTRFLGELEVGLISGANVLAVDLFDLRHAQKVLTAFGQAFGTLPAKLEETTPEQQQFLTQAVADLAPQGKVISVRLALFAEMMKGKVWSPRTLKQAGGTAGVGASFLEETFSSPAANPKHRLHQKAARAVLRALLPEAASDIKGSMRSYAELLAAAGYGSRAGEFDELLHILDGETRLLTPVDPESSARDGEAPSEAPPGEKYYQLTHDYLIPALREWLTRKQKETWQGRAELRLAGVAAQWNAYPAKRQLPAWWQWANIRLLTRKRDWTASQAKMMQKATRHHAVRAALLVIYLILFGVAGLEGFGRLKARTLVDQLGRAATSNVPGIIDEMAPYRRWANPRLVEAYAQADADRDARKQLHASLALLPVDAGQVEYLYQRLLTAEPQEVAVIAKALKPHRAELIERLWTALEDPTNDAGARLRAACALALYDRENPKWGPVSRDVVERLIKENPMAFRERDEDSQILKTWIDALQPVGDWLMPSLQSLLEKRSPEDPQRPVIAKIYSHFVVSQVPSIARLKRIARLEARLSEASKADAPRQDRVALAEEQANAAASLLGMGRGEKVWPLLRHRPDPTLRSFLIERLGLRGVDPNVLLDRLDHESDVSARRALLLSLGAFPLDRLPLVEREKRLPSLVQRYRNDPDAGIHGATEWLLRQWQADDKLKDLDQELRTGKAEGDRQWYVNGQGHTMVIVTGPVEFWMGAGTRRHQRQIKRSFAIASKEVTVEQFRRCRADLPYNEKAAPTGDCPINAVTWYEAAEYCNWLSKQEGLPEAEWCYVPNREGHFGPGMRLAADYLKRTGYRLPTEAEWEYACRAGAVTDRPFGRTEELIGQYAWHVENSLHISHPVGRLKPNDLGLFDMLGNAFEWCHGMAVPQPTAENQTLEDREDEDDMREVTDDKLRLMCGGSFEAAPRDVRSTHRDVLGPYKRRFKDGFRLARTVP